MHGFVEIRIPPHKKWDSNVPMVLVCMPCREMCGSGTLIGGVPILNLVEPTVVPVPPSEFFVAVPGTTTQVIYGCLNAMVIFIGIVIPTLVSVFARPIN